jgi:hypothetical protein
LVYVVECKYEKWGNKTKTRVVMSCPLFGQKFVWKKSDIMRYGMVRELSDSMVLVDREFAVKYPKVLGG